MTSVVGFFARGQLPDRLLQVFATVLDPNTPDQVGDQVRAELIRRIGVLNTQDPAKIQQYGLSAYV